MEGFLMVSGQELLAPVDKQARIILDLAAGQLSRDAFLEWAKYHSSPAKQ